MSTEDTNPGDNRRDGRATVTGLAMAAALVTPTVACAGKQPAPTEQVTQPPQSDEPVPNESDEASAESTEQAEGPGETEDVAADGPGDWSNPGGARG